VISLGLKKKKKHKNTKKAFTIWKTVLTGFYSSVKKVLVDLQHVAIVGV